ncbi:Dirigent protein 21 [Forsythia ovata]|uniref:Dirigent protein n=1 Tax=Forsythia ovata TaxID=205694 RepID=A0ABD1QQR0_9LAMI
MAMLGAFANAQMTMLEEQGFGNLCQGNEKVAKLHFYLQDVLGGLNATVWEVARSEITSTSPTSFGQVRVIDDLITAEPDSTSVKLGRAQGLITYADLENSGLTMNINFVFTAGIYNESTVCLLGRNPMSQQNRELAVVGGTGVFRMARGYAISNTYSFDPVTNYGVLEYTVYVAYVESGFGPLASH